MTNHRFPRKCGDHRVEGGLCRMGTERHYEPDSGSDRGPLERVVVTVRPLTEEYGQSSGLPGLSVTIDKKEYKTGSRVR